MQKLIWLFLLALALLPLRAIAEGLGPMAIPSALATPVPAPMLTPVPSAGSKGLYLGAGWPEVKLRYGFNAPIDLEAKAAFGSGMQVYSGRLYWAYLSGQDLSLTLGMEGGYMNLAGADGLYGGGAHGGLFTGVEAPLGPWLRLSLDLGPDYLEVHSGSQSVSNLEWVVTTGIYLKLF
jgi:hypothetical protein